MKETELITKLIGYVGAFVILSIGCFGFVLYDMLPLVCGGFLCAGIWLKCTLGFPESYCKCTFICSCGDPYSRCFYQYKKLK